MGCCDSGRIKERIYGWRWDGQISAGNGSRFGFSHDEERDRHFQRWEKKQKGYSHWDRKAWCARQWIREMDNRVFYALGWDRVRVVGDFS
jgi:hypothetical protein